MDNLEYIKGGAIIFSTVYQLVKISSLMNNINDNYSYGILKRNPKTKKLDVAPKDMPIYVLPFPFDVTYIFAQDLIEQKSSRTIDNFFKF